MFDGIYEGEQKYIYLIKRFINFFIRDCPKLFKTWSATLTLIEKINVFTPTSDSKVKGPKHLFPQNRRSDVIVLNRCRVATGDFVTANILAAVSKSAFDIYYYVFITKLI